MPGGDDPAQRSRAGRRQHVPGHDPGTALPPGTLLGCRRRTAHGRDGAGAPRSRSRRGGPAGHGPHGRTPEAHTAARPYRPGSRGVAPTRTWRIDPGNWGGALYFGENRRSSRATHLHEDRCLHPRRRGHVRDATRSRPNPSSLKQEYQPLTRTRYSDQFRGFDETCKIRRKAIGLLPVGRMSGGVIHHQPRARDNRRLRLLLTSRHHFILIAPDKQGWSLDLVKLSRKVVLQRARDRRFPYPRREFQALPHERFHERVRHRPDNGALLKLPHEAWVNRIFQRRYHGVPNLLGDRVVRQAEERPFEDKPVGALGMVYRNALRDGAAQRMADNDSRL